MKVNGSSGLGSAAPAGGSARAAPGFALPNAGAAADVTPTARMANISGVGSIDALIALQEVDGPLERRRRSVKRAGVILDVLDDIKLALLDGDIAPTALERLMGAVQRQRESVDDPRLEGLLDEIEVRAAVELAKLEMNAAHA
jgi:hypothetical protein